VEDILSFDQMVFQKVNQSWSNGFFDWLLPNITDLHKSPLALIILLLLLAIWVWRQKTLALKWIFIALVSVALSDVVCYRGIKGVIKRERPQFTGIEVNLRTKVHAGPSFPSNHAANMFTAATVLSAPAPYLAPVFFGVAALIAYSRVYVGVHFPIDVISGALIGLIIGLIARRIGRRWVRPVVRSDVDSSLEQSSSQSS
jgi:undecaprenyl-diphosphatase